MWRAVRSALGAESWELLCVRVSNDWYRVLNMKLSTVIKRAEKLLEDGKAKTGGGGMQSLRNIRGSVMARLA
jgi:hypothetical protein